MRVTRSTSELQKANQLFLICRARTFHLLERIRANCRRVDESPRNSRHSKHLTRGTTRVTKNDHLKRVQHSSSMTGMPKENSPNADAMNSSAEFQHDTFIRQDSLESGQPPGHQWQERHRNTSFVTRSAFISIPNIRIQSDAGKGPTAGPTATRVTATSVVTILKNHIIIRGAEQNQHGCHE